MERSSDTSAVLERGLRVLESVVQSREGQSISELALLVQLHRSSVYRYVNTLQRAGLIRKGNDDRYRAGSRLLELSGLALEQFDIRTLIHPHLIDLSENTNATAHLCQLEGLGVVYIDKVSTSRSLPLYSRIGGRAPLHCTGVGKALLAFQNERRAKHLIGRLSLEAYTARTITDRQRLWEELANARKLGYAIDRGEHEEGIWCVAVPIWDHARQVIASVSVTDSARKLDGQVDWYLQHLQTAARAIDGQLGSLVSR